MGKIGQRISTCTSQTQPINTEIPAEKQMQAKKTKHEKKAVNQLSCAMGLVPGPSAIHISDVSTSDSGDENDDSEKCCVCRKWQPDDMNCLYRQEFIKWAQCSKCSH